MIQHAMKKTTSKAVIVAPKKSKATSVPKRTYRMPDGSITTSATKYSKEWRRIGEDFGSIIGGELFGFDPTLSYKFSDSVHTNTFDPLVVIKILDHIAEEKIASYDSGYYWGWSYDDQYY
jgi:hypothetical protein